jgi:hypothetical protein
MVVNKLEEAINLLVPNHKGIFKNKIITIEKEFTKNDRVVKSQIRPDIWFVSEHINPNNQIPDPHLNYTSSKSKSLGEEYMKTKTVTE